MKPKFYRLIEHTADIGFEVKAMTRKTVFEAAALALFDLMWKAGVIAETEPGAIEVTGADRKELMVNFLEEFLYLYEAKGLICTNLHVETPVA